MAKKLAAWAIAGALLFGAGCDAGWIADRGPERMASLNRSKMIESEKRLDVNLRYGVGRLTLSPADPNVLYKLDLDYDANRTAPSLHYTEAGDRGRLDFDLESHRGRHNERARLDVSLTDALPLDLRLRTGVSEARVDLSGLQLQSLEVEGGVGQTVLSFTKANPIPCERILLRSGVGEFKVVGLGNANANSLLLEGGIGAAHLDLTGPWRRDAELEMRLGIGEVTLVVPPEVGMEIEGHKGFLSSVHLTDFDKYDGRYRSRNYGKSKYHLFVRIKTGIGSVRVRWA